MKHSGSPIHFAVAFARPLPSQLSLLVGAFFLLLSGACFGATAPLGNIHSGPESISVHVRSITLPDNITWLPCTDQFATDLAGLDWRTGVEADTSWQAAFSIALPVFTAYKRYKDCLKTTYPGAENAPR